MSPETALRLAGPGVVLVSRPSGVAHAYIGPLTPSGRFVPRSARTVCRTRTRRLQVTTCSTRRLCARCSVCLSEGEAGKQTGLCTRDQYRRRFAHVTPWDLVREVRTVTAPAELDDVAHLTLVLFGVTGCQQPVPMPDGRQSAPLNKHIGWHRQRVLGFPQRQKDRDLTRLADDVRRRRNQQRHEDREAAIDRFGFNTATR